MKGYVIPSLEGTTKSARHDALDKRAFLCANFRRDIVASSHACDSHWSGIRRSRAQVANNNSSFCHFVAPIANAGCYGVWKMRGSRHYLRDLGAEDSRFPGGSRSRRFVLISRKRLNPSRCGLLGKAPPERKRVSGSEAILLIRGKLRRDRLWDSWRASS